MYIMFLLSAAYFIMKVYERVVRFSEHICKMHLQCFARKCKSAKCKKDGGLQNSSTAGQLLIVNASRIPAKIAKLSLSEKRFGL